MKEAKDKFFAIGENATEQQFNDAYTELIKYKDQWEWDVASYSSIVINVVYFTEKYHGSLEALKKLEDIFPEYEAACKFEYYRKSNIHEIWARLLIEQNDESAAYEHLKKAAYFIFIDNVSYNDFEFFSFRNFTEYSLADIQNNTICLANPSTFNDPMDTILLRWNEYCKNAATDDVEKRLRMLYQKVFEHIKVRCFVKTEKLPRNEAPNIIPITKHLNIEDVNPLMWAHYAQNHNGFCIKYKLASSDVNNNDNAQLVCTRMGNVNYVPEMNFGGNTSFTVIDSLFAKHDVWSYEKEVRLVQYDAYNNDDYKLITISPDAIQSIYLGLRCSDLDREKMKLILRNRNIRLYQMKVDSADSYKLVKERIF